MTDRNGNDAATAHVHLGTSNGSVAIVMGETDQVLATGQGKVWITVSFDACGTRCDSSTG